MLAGLVWALALVSLVSAASGQRRERGPRAVAVLEFPAGIEDGSPRLVPLTIFDNGKFYDAAVYKAAPRPMALEDGVVYEAQREGLALGYFTVGSARKTGDVWLAQGAWQRIETEARTASPSAAQPRQPRATSEEPPVLRRPGTSPAQPQSESASSHSRVYNQQEPPDTSEGDPDRPVLKRRPPSGQSSPEAATAPAPPPSAAQAPRVPAAAPQPSVPAKEEALVAVSDATETESHPYSFAWSPEEKDRLTRAMAALAAAEIEQQRHATRGLRRAQVNATPRLLDVQVRALDLDSDNIPELVLTARRPASSDSPETYITLVARADLDREPRKLFSSITDAQHLDAFPRLELVDAVDAEGNGRGELLFRQGSRSGHFYTLYRVGPDSLSKLF